MADKKIIGDMEVRGNLDISGNSHLQNSNIIIGEIRTLFDDTEGEYNWLDYFGQEYNAPTFNRLGAYSARVGELRVHETATIYDNNLETFIPLAAEKDLSNNTFTPESDFTVDMQHFYKIGHMVFGHIVIHRNSAVSSTGIYKIGTVSVRAQHEHLFTATCYNGSTANSDAAIIKTNGDVMLRLTGTTSASTYNWDLSFFFCEEN